MYDTIYESRCRSQRLDSESQHESQVTGSRHGDLLLANHIRRDVHRAGPANGDTGVPIYT
jgi:hypothetical protein